MGLLGKEREASDAEIKAMVERLRAEIAALREQIVALEGFPKARRAGQVGDVVGRLKMRNGRRAFEAPDGRTGRDEAMQTLSRGAGRGSACSAPRLNSRTQAPATGGA